MKIWKLLWIFAFGSMHLFASGPNFLGKKIDHELKVSYSYHKDNWIMGLSDGSCWQLMPLKEKRKQTWGEWWKSESPKEWELPDEFFFDPTNWMGNYDVSVYEASDSIATGYNFILMNEQTEQVVFAKFISHGTELIPKVEYAKTVVDRGDPLSSRILCKAKASTLILVMDDKTIWQLDLYNQNTRSLSQWWQGEEIDQPDASFLSTKKDWNSFDEIAVYHASFDNNDLFEKYRVSMSEQEIYLIENLTTKKLAYATSVPFKNFLAMLDEHAVKEHKRGYGQGYSEGYIIGKKDGEILGYHKGYRDGQAATVPPADGGQATAPPADAP